MFTLIPWSEDLNLNDFYSEAARRGFDNNSSQKKMIDCLRNERKWAAWILYKNNIPVGSVAAHSFDDIMGPDSYRICVRTCSFAEAVERKSIITVKKLILEHQNLTSQFFIPQCIEWCGKDKNIYITSNDSKIGSQRHVHNIYFPILEKDNVVTKIKNIYYRNIDQTVWKLNVNQFYQKLNQFPRWTH